MCFCLCVCEVMFFFVTLYTHTDTHLRTYMNDLTLTFSMYNRNKLSASPVFGSGWWGKWEKGPVAGGKTGEAATSLPPLAPPPPGLPTLVSIWRFASYEIFVCHVPSSFLLELIYPCQKMSPFRSITPGLVLLMYICIYISGVFGAACGA